MHNGRNVNLWRISGRSSATSSRGKGRSDTETTAVGLRTRGNSSPEQPKTGGLLLRRARDLLFVCAGGKSEIILTEMSGLSRQRQATKDQAPIRKQARMTQSEMF